MGLGSGGHALGLEGAKRGEAGMSDAGIQGGFRCGGANSEKKSQAMFGFETSLKLWDRFDLQGDSVWRKEGSHEPSPLGMPAFEEEAEEESIEPTERQAALGQVMLWTPTEKTC